jgi:hypothetical protein
VFFHFSYSTVDSFKEVYTKEQFLKGELASESGRTK